MKITTQEQYLQMIEGAQDRPLLVEFTADWCPSCKALQPFINALEAKSLDTSQFDIGIVDIDEVPDVLMLEDIPHVPTLKVYYRGKSHTYEGPFKPSRLSLYIDELTRDTPLR